MFKQLSLFDILTEPAPIITETPKIIKGYGLPYKGSKRGIALQLFNAMLEIKPRAKYFYDLFGGGGAMSAIALQAGLKVYYNEISTQMCELMRFLRDNKEIPQKWYEWVDRDTFNKYKNEPSAYGGFVSCCYFFGNNGRTYLFADNIEKVKKLGHKFCTGKYKNADLPFCEFKNSQERRRFLSVWAKKEFNKLIKSTPQMAQNYKKYCDIMRPNSSINKEITRKQALEFTSWLRSTGVTRKEIDTLTASSMSSHYLTQSSQPAIPTIENWEKIKKSEKIKDIPAEIELLVNPALRLEQLERLQQLERLERLQQLERLERLQQLEQLERLQQLEQLQISNSSYSDVLITTPIEETIVYLDPPYRGTDAYKTGDFDFNKLDKWFKNNKYTCFMSEYNAPFESVYEIEKVVKYSAYDNRTKKLEKLYCNFNGLNNAQKECQTLAAFNERVKRF